MYFLHYYIQRGFSLEYLLGLGVEKGVFILHLCWKPWRNGRKTWKAGGRLRERCRKYQHQG